MTREDINDIINAICPNDEDYEKPCISPKYLRQELEQLALDQRQWNKELTTKNDLGVDCISRADAIHAVSEALKRTFVEHEDVANKIIGKLPSVAPIRPKGHWIYDKSFANWICSKCGETPKTMGYVGTGAFMAEHFKYCNHCGTEMEGSEEEWNY